MRSPTNPADSRVAPTWATLLLTWVNNLGAATALIGIYFITVNKYGFTGRENLLLGLLQGVTYIAGALTAGPGMRWISRRTGLSTRAILTLIHVAIFALCAMPLIVERAWGVWVMVGLYAALTGWLWPTIESYLSAGRSGHTLRRATGLFNIGWASSQVVAIWLLVPAMRDPSVSLWVLAGMGTSHLICIPFIAAIPREPAHFGGDASHAHSAGERARYVRLLAGFRIAIVLSYILYSALGPLLPLRTNALHVAAVWSTPLVSVWMIARVFTFALMQQWHGWHGRRRTLIWATGTLMLGFAAALLAPTWPVLLGALVFFGVGLGGVYSAAFYYAMEVGHAGVDAGGKHEALIGVGYSIGPLAALSARQLVPADATHEANNIAVLVACGILAVLVLGAAARIVMRRNGR